MLQSSSPCLHHSDIEIIILFYNNVRDVWTLSNHVNSGTSSKGSEPVIMQNHLDDA